MNREDLKKKLEDIREALLLWFRREKRDLPWRRERTPYTTWISEVLSQQTRMSALLPYYERFLQKYPSVQSLALAEEEELYKVWEGLGYYSRARNLKAAAIRCVDEYDASLPASREELLKLPGVGEYTAAAIASQSYGEAVAAIDGNTARVLLRLLAWEEEASSDKVKRFLREGSEDFLREREEISSGEWNEALMELGALVCLPNGDPLCTVCPLASFCTAGREGRWKDIPKKKEKKERRKEERTVLLLSWQGKTGIRKRPEKGLLSKLYEFPSLDGRKGMEEIRELFQGTVEEDDIEPLGEAKHIFSHIEWHMQGFRILLTKQGRRRAEELFPGVFFPERESLGETYAIPGAFSYYREKI